MLHVEYIDYLKRENKLIYAEFANYYIQRKLRRFVQIDKKILDKEKKKNYIIVHSEEDFVLECKKNDNEESIHFLKKDNDSKSLIWQKSRGPISDLNGFIIKSYFRWLSDNKTFFFKVTYITMILFNKSPK